MKIKSISDLRKLYPKSHYQLIRSRTALEAIGRRRVGVYMVAELSSYRGRQRVLYWRID